MQPLLNYFRSYAARRHVRPWSLAVPILVIVVCVPLMSPGLHPSRVLSDEEAGRWATVQALVENQTFAIDGTKFAATSTSRNLTIADATYSNQPPTQPFLLAGPYWVMRRYFGLSLREKPALVQYLLTIIGVTIPVAAASGMLYRMGRLFELRRPWRTGLAATAVFGSGLVSYATVLNSYAPAASLVLGATAILVQVSLVKSAVRSGGYLIAAGFFTALATAICPPAVVFLLTFPLVILALNWRWSARVGGILLYAIGVLPPLLLHVSLSIPITGDWSLGLNPTPPATATVIKQSGEEESEFNPPSRWQSVWTIVSRVAAAAVGSHGVFTHFPVAIIGLFGLFGVIRRHWPGPTKMLAAATLTAVSVVGMRYVLAPADFKWAMFGINWYIVFLPMLVFWAGAWLRKAHRPATWAAAGVLTGVSVIVTIIGALDPMPHDGYDRYTPVGVVKNVVAGE